MEKTKDPVLQTQEQIAVNKFAKCAAYLRKHLDGNTLLAEYPEAKELIFQKYLALARLFCKECQVLDKEIICYFIDVLERG